MINLLQKKHLTMKMQPTTQSVAANFKRWTEKKE
jgi:hypothetical protein